VTDLFPAGALTGREVFIDREGGNTMSIMELEHVYPAEELGLDADPKLLKVARDTVESLVLIGAADSRRNPWRHFNWDCIFFPVTVRIGYNPEVVWRELHSSIVEVGGPNGFRADNPHGLEKANTVPNTVNEMMLLSHENVLRFFRVWPRKSHPNARFRDLRAYGAFRVSAALTDGEVVEVRILSEKGRDCTVENPWPSKSVTAFRDGRKAEIVQGEKFILKTKPGELIELRA
jgi:alpha-L-fucosidase 2